MSDYHAISVSSKRNAVTVAFHFAVPSETNVAGKNLSDCVAEHVAYLDTTEGIPVTQVPNHATDHATENAALIAGTKIEVVETVTFNRWASNATKLAAIEAAYTALESTMDDTIRQDYKFWGYNGDVT